VSDHPICGDAAATPPHEEGNAVCQREKIPRKTFCVQPLDLALHLNMVSGDQTIDGGQCY
jgi:hypothetical protein